jgi:hypothetical protein
MSSVEKEVNRKALSERKRMSSWFLRMKRSEAKFKFDFTEHHVTVSWTRMGHMPMLSAYLSCIT